MGEGKQMGARRDYQGVISEGRSKRGGATCKNSKVLGKK